MLSKCLTFMRVNGSFKYSKNLNKLGSLTIVFADLIFSFSKIFDNTNGLFLIF